MREYKRLTKKADVILLDCEYSCGGLHLDVVKRLGELEDKIENGTLIELPCPRHTMVYIICCHRKKYIIIETPFTYDMIDSYQCNWFLTKAEAEAKLKELQSRKM